MADAPVVAYLSSGRLMIKRPGMQASSIASRFAEEVRTRASRIARKHEWKTQGTSAHFQRGMLWGFEQADAEHVPVQMTSVIRGRQPGQLIYAVRSGSVSGVFSVDANAAQPEATERRLFHTAELAVEHLGGVQEDGYICCSVRTKGGAHLAVLRDDGSEVVELTEGDSIESAPAWIAGADRQLTFQTAGIGRDVSGNALGLAPLAVHRLDVPSGEISTLLASPDCDYLGPRLSAAGRLTCIRRPHRAVYERPSSLTAFADLLLFPIRVLFAILQWLNFFTTTYTGKSLTTAGPAKQKGADAKRMMIWGNLIDAREAAKDAERYGDDPNSAVPRSWQLLAGRVGDELQVLAKGVVCYDVARDGSLVFSNGNAIYHLDLQGHRHKLDSADEITAVAILE